jgi:hypothetical protein
MESKTVRRSSGTRPLISSFPTLPISALHLRGWRYTDRYGPATRAGGLIFSRGGVETGKVRFSANIGQECGRLTLECSFNNEVCATVESIEIVSVANAWGGRHWFFECPATGKRARKLYRWPGLGFSHREASPVPPVYGCQQDSGLGRTARAMDEIRRRLGGVPGKIEKPTGMPLKTFYRLTMRYVRVARKVLAFGWGPLRLI